MSTSLYENLAGAAGYQGIARAVRGRITRGELRPGQQLPSLGELGRACGATPITVRRALRLLEEEGLVRVEHGVGTFVNDWPRRYDEPRLPSFADEMAARHRRVTTRILERGEGAREPAAAAALGAAREAGLAVLVRLREVDGVPVVLQRTYLPAALAGVVAALAPEESLYDALRERTGRLPAAAEERLQAVALPAEAAALLGLPPGAAGLRSDRLTATATGEPLAYDVAFFAGDRAALRMRRRGGRTEIELEILETPPPAGSLPREGDAE